MTVPKPPQFLACPECRSAELRPSRDLEPAAAPFASREGLRCKGCGRAFPFVDGVWVMWSDAVRRLQLESPGEGAALADRVKRANIDIYDDVSAAYEEHSDGRLSYRDTLLFMKAIAADRASPANGAPRVAVDVGCGPGIGLEAGAALFDEVVGLDISLSNLRAVAGKGFVAVLGDAERLPFAEGSLHVVSCFAALHHFPEPAAFVASAHAALRPGGTLVTALDPSRGLLGFGPLARFVWDLRKPVYRLLATRSKRFYLHQDRATQERNELAEHSRSAGGFSEAELSSMFERAGFSSVRVFFGVDSEGQQAWALPPWKLLLLQSLSFRNPLRCANWAPLSAVGRKAGV
jgi:SAM-dependent methyltransferase/uncharacterized protein YbaR (Trm112 family)